MCQACCLVFNSLRDRFCMLVHRLFLCCEQTNWPQEQSLLWSLEQFLFKSPLLFWKLNVRHRFTYWEYLLELTETQRSTNPHWFMYLWQSNNWACAAAAEWSQDIWIASAGKSSISQVCIVQLWRTRNIWSILSTSSVLAVSSWSGRQPGAAALRNKYHPASSSIRQMVLPWREVQALHPTECSLNHEVPLLHQLITVNPELGRKCILCLKLVGTWTGEAVFHAAFGITNLAFDGKKSLSDTTQKQRYR